MFAKKAVFIAGDEGAYFLPPQGRGFFIPINDPLAGDAVLCALREMPRTEIDVTAAMQAGEVRAEEIPPVGFFDRSKLLARRVKKEFPDAVFAGIVAKRKNRAVVAALHPNGAFSFWKETLDKLPYPTRFFRLLPVEASLALRELAPETKRGWGLFVFRLQLGGWQQIVTQEGWPVFSRLTPALSDEASFEEKAAALRREILGTLDYLPRLGFENGDDISALALADTELQNSLRRLSWPMATSYMSPSIAAARYSIFFDPKTETCDEFFAALCRKRKPVLAFVDPAQRAENRKRQIRFALTTAGLLALAGGFVFAASFLRDFKAPPPAQTAPQKVEEPVVSEERIAPLTTPLRLDAIYFVDQNEWAVWINGEEYRPDKQPVAFSILDVVAGVVRLGVPTGEILLSPNQSYDPETKETSEGNGTRITSP
jgi:hypothetical protein